MNIILDLDKSKEFGKLLGENLFPSAFISFYGDLGAGKTTFTKFIAEGMGISANVKSPTFSILNIYNGTIPLYHFDFYRLHKAEAEDLGFDDYFFGEGVSVCEWSENISSLLPKNRLEIKIEKKGLLREFNLSVVGEDDRYLNLIKKMEEFF